jgi:hypothetical protein
MISALPEASSPFGDEADDRVAFHHLTRIWRRVKKREVDKTQPRRGRSEKEIHQEQAR